MYMYMYVYACIICPHIHNTGIIVYISILYRDYHHLGRGRFQEWLTRKHITLDFL